MRALVYHGHKTVTLDDVPEPILEEGEVLIAPKYVGICGSDINASNDGIKRMRPPVILGHEFSGVVVDVKSNLPHDLREGDRVIVEPQVSCGRCEPCRSGNYHVCRTFKIIGVDTDGAFANYVKVPLERVYKVPGGMGLDLAALTEPLAVSTRAVRRGGVGVGDFVVVLGAGPIGLFAAQVSKVAGASEVVITDINPFRLGMAKNLGFTALDSKETDPIEYVKDVTRGRGADVVIEAVGLPPTMEQAVPIAKIQGRIVVVGIFKKAPVPVDLITAAYHELTLVGSKVYTYVEFSRALDMLASGRVKGDVMITHRMDLSSAIEAFGMIKRGEDVMKVLIKP
ncbi:MAG: zinc-dependent alcohol dehydrogenase [bacterium]